MSVTGEIGPSQEGPRDLDILFFSPARSGCILELGGELFCVRHRRNRSRTVAPHANRPFSGVQLQSMRTCREGLLVRTHDLRGYQRGVMRSVACRLLGTSERDPVHKIFSAVGISVRLDSFPTCNGLPRFQYVGTHDGGRTRAGLSRWLPRSESPRLTPRAQIQLQSHTRKQLQVRHPHETHPRPDCATNLSS